MCAQGVGTSTRLSLKRARHQVFTPGGKSLAKKKGGFSAPMGNQSKVGAGTKGLQMPAGASLTGAKMRGVSRPG